MINSRTTNTRNNITHKKYDKWDFWNTIKNEKIKKEIKKRKNDMRTLYRHCLRLAMAFTDNYFSLATPVRLGNSN